MIFRLHTDSPLTKSLMIRFLSLLKSSKQIVGGVARSYLSLGPLNLTLARLVGTFRTPPATPKFTSISPLFRLRHSLMTKTSFENSNVLSFLSSLQKPSAKNVWVCKDYGISSPSSGYSFFICSSAAFFASSSPQEDSENRKVAIIRRRKINF